MATRQVPASFGQRLLWLMEHYRGHGQGLLNQPLALRLAGPVDMAALNDAYSALVARHEALRTTFTGRGGRLCQVIHHPEPMRIREHDLRTAADPWQAAYEAFMADLRTPVDPTRWPVRATAWRSGLHERILCLNMHHLVTDDWSCSILARDLGLLYRQARGANVTLPHVAWQFADWVGWQHKHLSGARLRKLDGYWRAKLARASGPRLPAAGDAPTADARSWDVDIDSTRVELMRTIAGQERATTYPFLLAVYLIQLSAQASQEDIAVSSIFANRTRAEIANTVGFFVNMVILRAGVHPGDTFRDLLRQVRRTSVEALSYQSFPYQMLPAGTLAPSAPAPRDIVFQMLDANETAFSVDGIDSSELLMVETGRFPLELAFFPQGDGLRGTLFYHSPQFDDEWAHDLLAGCAATAYAALDAPDATIADLIAVAEKSHDQVAATVTR